MGIERSGASKSPTQGEAGYLTQDQLDELNAPAMEAPMDSEVAEPANAESHLPKRCDARLKLLAEHPHPKQ